MRHHDVAMPAEAGHQGERRKQLVRAGRDREVDAIRGRQIRNLLGRALVQVQVDARIPGAELLDDGRQHVTRLGVRRRDRHRAAVLVLEVGRQALYVLGLLEQPRGDGPGRPDDERGPGDANDPAADLSLGGFPGFRDLDGDVQGPPAHSLDGDLHALEFRPRHVDAVRTVQPADLEGELLPGAPDKDTDEGVAFRGAVWEFGGRPRAGQGLASFTARDHVAIAIQVPRNIALTVCQGNRGGGGIGNAL